MRFSEKEILFGSILIILIIGAGVILFIVNQSYCGDGICGLDENEICLADCNWCGDRYCEDPEKGNCKVDCNWCDDGYCQLDESCSTCPSDCGSCKADSYCGDGICNPGECNAGCSKDCNLVDCQNSVCEMSKGENCLTTPGDCACGKDQKCDQNKLRCVDITCGNGRCDSGETSKTCPNDCSEEYEEILYDSKTDYPIIFVHGHSKSESETYSPIAFQEFQDKLTEEGFEDMGIMLPSDYPPKLTKGIWAGKKISVIMTYYANKYDKLGGVVGKDDNQHISIYAQRLKNVVETVKHNTGKDKVIIIAHSMGGLVSRTYIKYYNGNELVDKLVMIGTPNHGTYGYIKFGCGTIFVGRNPTPECEDMDHESDFIIELNKDDESYGSVKYLTIIGNNDNSSFCPNNEYWDNVICSSSVYLNGAENYYYEDSSPTNLHTIMTSPSKAPKVYNKVVSFID